MQPVDPGKNLEAPQDQVGMHGPTPILGPDGQPLRKQVAERDRRALGEEIAGAELIGARALWDQSTVAGLTPERLAALLRGAIRGDIRPYLELAQEMEERYPHYASVLGTRKRSLSGVKPSIAPYSDKRVDRKIAEEVEELINTEAMPDLIEDMLDGLGKGFSVVEIVWASIDGRWKPVEYLHRDPLFFTFDFISRTEVRLNELGTIDGLQLQPAKFIVHKPKLKSGIPIRGGLARLCAWAFMFNAFTMKDWMTFLDVYGMPVRVGKYHPAATPDERRSLLRAVSSIATDAAAIIPESMQIEFIEAKSTAGHPFEAFGKYLDQQVSKAVLGQTSSADDSATVGQARIHDEVRIDIQQADGRQLARTLNRDLVRWYVTLNFGEHVPAPRIEFNIAQPQDILALSAALQRTVPLGLKVSQDEVREKFGLSKPEEDDEVLTPPAPGAPKAGAMPDNQGVGDLSRALGGRRFFAHEVAAGATENCRCGTCLAIAASETALDDPDNADVDELDQAGAADWERQTGPAIEAILKAARETSSFEAFEARLKALYAGLDMSVLETRLAVAQVKARGVGQGGQ